MNPSEETAFATGRFEVVDADGHRETVVERTVYVTRSRGTTHFRPRFESVAYGLEDGTAVRRVGERRFVTAQGRCFSA
jgi:hypothetical protein